MWVEYRFEGAGTFGVISRFGTRFDHQKKSARFLPTDEKKSTTTLLSKPPENNPTTGDGGGTLRCLISFLSGTTTGDNRAKANVDAITFQTILPKRSQFVSVGASAACIVATPSTTVASQWASAGCWSTDSAELSGLVIWARAAHLCEIRWCVEWCDQQGSCCELWS